MLNFDALDRTFIIAEIGVNHEGDVAVAEDLIHKAADAGADAVKFQTFSIEHYISTVQPERRARTTKFQLSEDEFRRLAAVAADRDVIFFSTPFHTTNADFLDSLAPIFKISSGDLTHLDLIRHVAALGKPMIVSTGLGTADEVATAVEAILEVRPGARDDGSLCLMHCVSAYPTPAEEANLRNITWLRETFSVPVGYSDHTLGIEACVLAVALGARVLEKHFTYRKENQDFHDHLLSADPEDLARLVQAVRSAERYLGSPGRDRGVTEAGNEANMRRSVGALVDIPAGTPVRRDQLTWLRPAWGIGPDRLEEVVGLVLARDVPAGDLLTEDDVAAARR